MSSVNTSGQQEKVDPEFQVLLHAVASCSGVAVQQLLRQNPTLVNQKGWHGQSPLHRACLSGDVAMVRLLCEHGADPNVHNEFKETPVHYAAKRGIPTLVHVLLKFGAKLDIRDAAGKTPVHNAAETGSVYMLKYFEEQGFGFKDVDDKGQTTLHFVCSYGHLDAFKFLLRKGRTDPTHKNKEGDTALHICVREGYAHGSWLLINYLGVSCLNVTNGQGLTPLDVCRQFDTSKKLGHKMLLPVLSNLSKLPQKSEIQGPVKSWYWNLIMPFMTYFVGIILAHTVLVDYQGLVYIAAVGLIVKTVIQASHRLPHISRWANPLHCGTFCAGIAHTMIVFYYKVGNRHERQWILFTCAALNAIQLYLYYKLLRADPGLINASVVNERTGQPTTLTELCEANVTLDSFCSDCEIIRTKVTKHCKICDRCYYRMDHHCLFLLKCIGYSNHARFVWFIIITVLVMSIFVFQCVLWTLDKYPRNEMTYTEILLKMFWSDGWILSMVVLNVASAIWAASLVQYQLKVVSRGHTTYFQHSISTLTPVEKLLNIVNFLEGKNVYATDITMDETQKMRGQTSRGIHDV